MSKRPSSSSKLQKSFDANALLTVLGRAGAGDFAARLPLDWTGVAGKIADGVNDVMIANQALERSSQG